KVVVVAVVWVVVTWCRVVYVTNPSNWWLMHPDEHFQSLEVAHTLTYGYGFRPYEFTSLPPGPEDGAAENVSAYRQRELLLGMHGMRSALYPRFFVFVSCVAAFFRLQVRPFVLWKAAHAIVSSLLPLSVYRFSRVYFRSQDAALLAAILVSTSVHVNVLGTHPLVHSFLSPPLFCSLAGLLPLVRGSERRGEQAAGDEPAFSWRRSRDRMWGVPWKAVQMSSSLRRLLPWKAVHVGKSLRRLLPWKAVPLGNSLRQLLPWKAVHVGNSLRRLLPWKAVQRPLETDQTRTRRGKQSESREAGPERTGKKKEESHEGSSHTSSSRHHGGGRGGGGKTGAAVTRHPPHRPTPLRPGQKDKGKELHPVAKCMPTWRSRVPGSTTTTTTTTAGLIQRLLPALHGFLLALCVYVRADAALFSALVLLSACRPTRAAYRGLVVSAVGVAAGAGLGVAEDCSFYGRLVLSPGNWARFNVLRGLSGALFGRSSSWAFLEAVCAGSAALPALAALHAVGLVGVLARRLRTARGSNPAGAERTTRAVDDATTTATATATTTATNNTTNNNTTINTTNYNNNNTTKTTTNINTNSNNKTTTDNTRTTTTSTNTNNNNHLAKRVDDRTGRKHADCRRKSGARKTPKTAARTEGSLRGDSTRGAKGSSEHTEDVVTPAPPRPCGSRGPTRRHSATWPRAALPLPAGGRGRRRGGLSGGAASLALCWLLLLLVHCCRDHKEVRFLHDPLVLMLVTSAALLCAGYRHVRRVLPALPAARVLCLLLPILLLFLFAADQWRCFPAPGSAPFRRWAYRGAPDSQDVNACLAFVSERRDVTGVFVDSPFHLTGAFTLLRHDVPLFTLLVAEFVEFDVSARTTLPQRSALDASVNVSYVTVHRLSDFVAVQNAGRAVKALLEKRRYNYVVLPARRRFIPHGFRQVFRQGAMRVMRRTADPRQEEQLQALAGRLPVGVNATVLMYEGDVLFRFNRFRSALSRYMAAFRLDSAHAHVFQAIAACQWQLGERRESERWAAACEGRFGPSQCRQPLTMTTLNADQPVF
ncbi:uncharacterized protein LOC143288236, partial [Babylonia areolata]|uniref:uncharacterized protein LOC143288236 n=1 Tax=Babylonia areolata TaxID=304850 RepID=UPI003FD29D8C